jgi:hypothetical protein
LVTTYNRCGTVLGTRLQVPPPKDRDDKHYLQSFVFQQVQGSNGFLPDKIRGNTNLENKGFQGGNDNLRCKGKRGLAGL